jgi:VIT1/CCC1 family predicted Fe2+/Mn2+ transporter
MKDENHYIIRSGWLRAAVLGANDGLLSTASLIIGVAAASHTKDPIIIAGAASLVAGALSMAAGEYVSVSSQSDIEQADLLREKKELKEMPESELAELVAIYEKRGLDSALALQVAEQLTAHNALETHARDELGINEMTEAKPIQAALASGASFISGGIIPVILIIVIPLHQMVFLQYAAALVLLLILGVLAAKAGGSNILKSVTRLTFWGTIAMAITALIGYLFDVNLT